MELVWLEVAVVSHVVHKQTPDHLFCRAELSYLNYFFIVRLVLDTNSEHDSHPRRPYTGEMIQACPLGLPCSLRSRRISVLLNLL